MIRTLSVAALAVAVAAAGRYTGAQAPSPATPVVSSPVISSPVISSPVSASSVSAGTSSPAISPALDAGLATLKDLSAGSQALYQKVSASMVRVKIDPETVIPADVRRDWEEFRDKWLQEHGPTTMGDDGGGPPVITIEPRVIRDKGPKKEAGEGREPRRGEHSREAVRRPAATNRPGLILPLFRRWVAERAQRDPGAGVRLRQALARIEVLRGGTGNGELSALVIDADGHALLMAPLSLPADKRSVQVTLPDGADAAATVKGTNFLRGFCILKLENGMVPPVALASGRPTGGELLMCLSSTNGAVGWVSAPGQAKKRRDERFPVYGSDERSLSFLFNTSGELAAVNVERLGLPAESFRAEIRHLIEKGDIAPHPLGVRYTPLPPEAPERSGIRALEGRPAVRVDEVMAKSIAERGGVKKGDIVVSIDRRSVAQLPRIIQDLPLRSGPVKLGIIRDGKELELDLPLNKQ